MSKSYVFRPLFDRESCTYTYIVGDVKTKEAIIIDSVIEHAARDIATLKRMGLKLKYALETHAHADHLFGGTKIQETLTDVKTCISHHSKADLPEGAEGYDLYLKDFETLNFGTQKITAIPTQGHTDCSVTYHFPTPDGEPDMLFTGDAVLVTKCGRTDFQKGDPAKLYDQVWGNLFKKFPKETLIYPGHDYIGQMQSTVGEEMEFNVRLGSGNTKAQFVEIMNNLKLNPPKRLAESVPFNIRAGKVDSKTSTS